MSTINPAQEQAIIELLDRATLPKGLGTESNPCSVAAINLALTGTLTDEIPECMSEVVGRWIIRIQDAMPQDMRNSAEWKRLLPQAAGTGRFREKERLDIILEWMWGVVLPTLQPLAADDHGFGEEWGRMLTERTTEAAWAAGWAAWAAAEAAAAARAAAEAAGVAWEQIDPPALLAKLIAVGV